MKLKRIRTRNRQIQNKIGYFKRSEKLYFKWKRNNKCFCHKVNFELFFLFSKFDNFFFWFQLKLIGLRNFAWIHTRYIFNSLPRFTWSLRSTKIMSFSNPDCSNSFSISSENNGNNLLSFLLIDNWWNGYRTNLVQAARSWVWIHTKMESTRLSMKVHLVEDSSSFHFWTIHIRFL